MAEENKGGLLDAAKEMMGNSGDLVDMAKDFVSEHAGDILEHVDSMKDKAVEAVKKITPDNLDDKVEGVVDQAIDMVKGALGKKEE